ncbi:MAG: GSU2403 family nucleotidyltransferase fold protein [Coriobacteriia bacterium]
MERQPLEIATLYAELLEQLTALEAGRAIGHVPGSFVTKRIKGADYYYYQYLEPGGTKRQTYVGKRDSLLDAFVERHAQGRERFSADATSIHRLASLLRVGGAMVTDAPSARTLAALANAGVFRLGGVLVGTHAFVAIGNLLGMRWTGHGLRTQDLDVAAPGTLGVAVPNLTADVPGVLKGLEMGFLPVPGFDPASPSTSFKVRGKGLRVDLLTPAKSGESAPVPVPRLRAAAQPLRFLDLLLESTVRAAIIDGGAVLVHVPDPARFALHKLIVAGERPTAMAVKSEKDVRQAAVVLHVLSEDRPGDVALAWEAVTARGKEATARARRGLSALARFSPGIAQGVESLL